MNLKNKKGQVSLEILAILGVLVLGGIIAGVYYISSINEEVTQGEEASNISEGLDESFEDLETPNYGGGSTNHGGTSTTCGDGTCDTGENLSNCPLDCRGFFGSITNIDTSDLETNIQYNIDFNANTNFAENYVHKVALYKYYGPPLNYQPLDDGNYTVTNGAYDSGDGNYVLDYTDATLDENLGSDTFRGSLTFEFYETGTYKIYALAKNDYDINSENFTVKESSSFDVSEGSGPGPDNPAILITNPVEGSTYYDGDSITFASDLSVGNLEPDEYGVIWTYNGKWYVSPDVYPHDILSPKDTGKWLFAAVQNLENLDVNDEIPSYYGRLDQSYGDISNLFNNYGGYTIQAFLIDLRGPEPDVIAEDHLELIKYFEDADSSSLDATITSPTSGEIVDVYGVQQGVVDFSSNINGGTGNHVCRWFAKPIDNGIKYKERLELKESLENNKAEYLFSPLQDPIIYESPEDSTYLGMGCNRDMNLREKLDGNSGHYNIILLVEDLQTGQIATDQVDITLLELFMSYCTPFYGYSGEDFNCIILVSNEVGTGPFTFENNGINLVTEEPLNVPNTVTYTEDDQVEFTKYHFTVPYTNYPSPPEGLYQIDSIVTQDGSTNDLRAYHFVPYLPSVQVQITYPQEDADYIVNNIIDFNYTMTGGFGGSNICRIDINKSKDGQVQILAQDVMTPCGAPLSLYPTDTGEYTVQVSAECSDNATSDSDKVTYNVITNYDLDVDIQKPLSFSVYFNGGIEGKTYYTEDLIPLESKISPENTPFYCQWTVDGKKAILHNNCSGDVDANHYLLGAGYHYFTLEVTDKYGVVGIDTVENIRIKDKPDTEFNVEILSPSNTAEYEVNSYIDLKARIDLSVNRYVDSFACKWKSDGHVISNNCAYDQISASTKYLGVGDHNISFSVTDLSSEYTASDSVIIDVLSDNSIYVFLTNGRYRTGACFNHDNPVRSYDYYDWNFFEGKCNAEAVNANLPGTYVPLLASPGAGQTINDKLNHYGASYIMKDYYTGQPITIADNWGDLVDGTLKNKINRDANGQIAKHPGNSWDNKVYTGIAGVADGEFVEDSTSMCWESDNNNLKHNIGNAGMEGKIGYYDFSLDQDWFYDDFFNTGEANYHRDCRGGVSGGWYCGYYNTKVYCLRNDISVLTSSLVAEISSPINDQYFSYDSVIPLKADISGGKTPYTCVWKDGTDVLDTQNVAYSAQCDYFAHAQTLGAGVHALNLEVTDADGSEDTDTIEIIIDETLDVDITLNAGSSETTWYGEIHSGSGNYLYCAEYSETEDIASTCTPDTSTTENTVTLVTDPQGAPDITQVRFFVKDVDTGEVGSDVWNSNTPSDLQTDIKFREHKNCYYYDPVTGRCEDWINIYEAYGELLSSQSDHNYKFCSAHAETRDLVSDCTPSQDLSTFSEHLYSIQPPNADPCLRFKVEDTSDNEIVDLIECK